MSASEGYDLGSPPEVFREVRVEELIGRKLCDLVGHKIGRIEELVAEQQDTDLVVVEVHVGPGALLERLIDLATLVPYSGTLQRHLRHLRRVPWHQLDLTDPDHPRTTVRREELKG
jgi:sporulation protein YlmC with PRC-barrel domain